ncbi:MAG: hypothetical protein CL789_02125 [Chloroflexi bacterium]|nr:hypothetical protein [Chloroflexota bacterium]HCU80651.1 hypothetical protein [Chloroflexota bacterium]|tara:strand:+ start:3311 stop:5767 length:2457 start_codon:yes stop_codon:yes gene_type:complete
MVEILACLYWWAIATFCGLLVWPLTFRMLGNLHDRGYAVCRAVGLLLVGYTFWILSSLGYLKLTSTGILVAFGICAIVGWRFGETSDALIWIRENRRYVLITEMLFVVTLGFWAYVRSHNPDIFGTEKPMEFAFMNSILRNGTMPPEDPWLSGYAISYYYFGYVIIALITSFSGVTSPVGFNLGLALVFGLTAVGIFGLSYNLISRTFGNQSRCFHKNSARTMTSPFVGAIVAPVIGLVSGNLNGLLEVLHQRGLGTGEFWRWLDIKWIDYAPSLSDSWMPERYLWWWQASRVVRDRNVDGSVMVLEPITEFPLFSFLLGDLHPHLLALPFVVLAIHVALQLYVGNKKGASDVIERDAISKNSLPTIDIARLLFFGLIIGGLSFLNTWDYPIYLFVSSVGYLLGRKKVGLGHLISIGMLIVVSILLYWPFYIGFQSQAAGVLPNVFYPTRIAQFMVMFGVLLVPVVGWLIWETAKHKDWVKWRVGVYLGVGTLMFLILVSVALSVLIFTQTELEGIKFSVFGAVAREAAMSEVIKRRVIESPWTSVFLTAILVVCASLAISIINKSRVRSSVRPFVLLLLFTGCLLTLVPEFVFLRDSFGARMNTVFKFYYQAWILWSIVASYGIWRVSYYGKLGVAMLYGTIVCVVLFSGLMYSVFSVWSKTQGFTGATMIGGNRVVTLDGTAYLQQTNKSDYDAIRWINHFLYEDGVIAEAVGGSYSEYARISTYTGLATVLGWPGHELQWRGGYEEFGDRESAIETLYSTKDWSIASDIMSRYAIKYVYLGELERRDYPDHGFVKFDNHMKKIYTNETVDIYELY